MKTQVLNEGIKRAMEAAKQCQDPNPLIVWDAFISTLEYFGRRTIGDELEAQGKNRFGKDFWPSEKKS